MVLFMALAEGLDCNATTWKSRRLAEDRVTYSNDLLHIDSLRLIRCIQISSNLKGGPITTCIGCMGIRCIGYGCSDMNGEGALQADLQIACLDNASFRYPVRFDTTVHLAQGLTLEMSSPALQPTPRWVSRNSRDWAYWYT